MDEKDRKTAENARAKYTIKYNVIIKAIQIFFQELDSDKDLHTEDSKESNL